MWEERALPWLSAHFASRLTPHHELTLRLLGVGESTVQLAVEDKLRALGAMEIGYCARPGEVDLRLIATDAALLAQAASVARAALGEFIYAEGATTMEEMVVRRAREAGKTIATAESCTGGLVAARLTNVPGSSAVFRFGWVTYADKAKTAELGVPVEVLAKHGAVSEQVARAMAEGALRASGADLAVAVTGIAGPDGGTVEKPVGLVWFGLARRDGETHAVSRNLSRTRATFRTMATQTALELVRRALAEA
jgi:nicotinamide-nucleotide amidase